MNELTSRTLGSVISISKGRKHEITNYSSRTSRRLIGIDDLRNDDLIRYTNDASGVEASSDDVLIAWDGANAGTVGYGKSGYIGSTIARLRIQSGVRLFAPFLGLYLKSKFDYLRQTATGATIPHVSRSALEDIPLPEVKFDNQIRIALLLGRVEGLISRRKLHLQYLDDLLKSAFLDMFSPKSAGYADWPLVEIKDLAAKHKGAMRTGPFGSNLLHNEFATEGNVAVLGIDNAVKNRFEWDEKRFITIEKYKELESYRVFPGDVIVTIMGTIGRSAVVPNDIPLAINTKHLAAITLDREIANPLFLSYSIHSSPLILSQFKNKNRGAIMSGLNLGLIKETKLKRPPIALQDKFAETHMRVDNLRAMYQQSIAELETLYGALSQQAFRGELDLSRVPLPSVQQTEKKTETAKPLQVIAELGHAIYLPDLDADNMPNVLEGVETRQLLMSHWLEAYRDQLGEAPFSVQTFLEAARTRLEELHPDHDVVLGAGDYDQIKAWAFKALADGRLTQAYHDDNNRIELRAVQA